MRAIRFVADVATAEDEVTLSVRGGALAADPAQDALLAAVLDRRGVGRLGLGVVRGFGLREGAFASTISFDTSDLVAIGASPEALAAAVRRAVELRGGLVVADGAGRVRAELALPLGGVISPLSVRDLAARLEAIQGAARELGCPLRSPLLTLETLTFAAIPALRLTSQGLLHVKSRRHLPPLL